jgi:hypothetical protein
MWWQAEWRMRDNSEQIADSRRLEIDAALVDHGLIWLFGGERKSESFASALKIRSRPRPDGGRSRWLSLLDQVLARWKLRVRRRVGGLVVVARLG